MNKNVIIYAIVRLETGDAYVGSTISLRDRWRTHRFELRHGKHHCRHLQNAWNKYGEDAFDFIVLAELICETREDRYVLETSWIMTHGTYNVLVASDRAGAFTITEEDRKRRSEGALAKIKSDPAYAAVLAKRGEEIAALARTPEARARMSEQTKESWTDPAMRERRLSGPRRRWGEEAETSKIAQSEAMSAYWKTNGAKEAHSARMRDQWADPASALRNRSNGRWADPEARARQAEKIRAAHDARRGGPKLPKPKKPKPITMGDLILTEMRANPSRIYMPSDLQKVCDPGRLYAATLITVTLGRLIGRGLVRKITQGTYGYQLA